MMSTEQEVSSRLPLTSDAPIGFEGIKETTMTPPSTNIAAGPEDVIQIVNATVARYTKTVEAVKEPTSSVTMQQWFAEFASLVCLSGTSDKCSYGDVSIRYDQMHGRFIMIVNALDTGAQSSYLLISVSNGATYASGWKNWALSMQYDGSVLAPQNYGDFPQIGFDDKAIYITMNMFSFLRGGIQYAKVRIIRKSDLYNSSTSALPFKDIFNLKNEDGTIATTLQAPHLRGRIMVKTDTGIMVNASDVVDGADYLTLWRINNPIGDNPTVTRSTIRGVWFYKYPSLAPQPNTVVGLNTGPSGISKVIMREGRLYVARSTGYDIEPDTVTYDLIDLTNNKVVSQTRWVNGNFFYPAFDVPATVGQGNNFPNQLIVGTTTSANGGLTFAGMTNMKDGEGVYDRLQQVGAFALWGDYNGASIDPIEGGMWASGEYAKKPTKGDGPFGTDLGHYGTWNTYFPWGTSKEFDDVPSTNENFNYVNVMKLWGLTKGCSIAPPLYCPATAATRENMAVFVIRALYGENFTYSQVPYFTDVPADNYAFAYIQKFKELGFTNGCSATTYCPATVATVQDAATFIVRAKMKDLFGENFTYPTTPYFTDVPATDPNFSYIQKFRELGIGKGCTATAFCQSSPLSREKMATFIIRAFFN